MELVINELHLENPPWKLRNKLISKMMEPNKSLLDLGCGAKNLLKYYTPTDYLGLDGMPCADIVCNLDEDFQNLVNPGWDYAVSSGVLEYVLNPELYLKRQKGLADKYILTWHPSPLWGRMPFDRIEEVIKKHYKIIDEQPWGAQKVYMCIDI